MLRKTWFGIDEHILKIKASVVRELRVVHSNCKGLSCTPLFVLAMRIMNCGAAGFNLELERLAPMCSGQGCFTSMIFVKVGRL